MEIKIKSCLEGARQAEGLTVIIDVFRASNTIITCLGQGAEYVIPVSELERAYQLKKGNPQYLLAGERNSQPPQGFDFSNSPSYVSALDLSQKKVILTTSAGTQGIVNAKDADEILIGSFANASAIVDYIQQKQPATVTLAAMGFASSEKAEEDEQCAFYLKERLLGRQPDLEQIRHKIRQSKGAARLTRIGRQDDMEFGLKLDLYNMVPLYIRDEGYLISKKKSR
jgi:2-phosphosulfolactate phosphatase